MLTWYALAMNLFCFLCLPLFYRLWRSIRGAHTPGGVLALVGGSIAVLLQFLVGPLVDPGGFGLSRWVSGLVDVVVLPAIAPIVVYVLLVCFKLIGEGVDFAGFTLLWLIPSTIIQALSISWGAQTDPLLLVLLPILYTAIAVGISFFIELMASGNPITIALSILAILVIPFASATSYWAFFSHQVLIGFLTLFVAAAPMLVSTVLSFLRGE